MSAVPPGWPRAVPPAGSPGWEDRAVTWLLDQAPADFRTYPLLRRQPFVLSWLVVRMLDGQVDAARAAYRVVRQDLRPLGPPAVDEVLVLLEEEGARLLARRRAAALVRDALGGRQFLPRL